MTISNITKAGFGTALVIIISLSISSCNIVSQKSILETELITHYPITIRAENSIRQQVFVDTTRVMKFNDLILYTLPPKRRLEDNSQIVGTQSYFILKTNASHGFWFKNLDSIKTGEKHLADSFLEKRAFRTMKFATGPIDSLVESSSSNETLIEKWVPRVSQGDNMYDSICFYFNKKKLVSNVFLSPELDSLKGMHLFKVRIVYNEKFSSSNNVFLPRREFYFETAQKQILKSDKKVSVLREYNSQ